MSHDSFLYRTWLIYINIKHDSFYVWDGVTYEWDMTHSYECMYQTGLIHIWDMTHSYMRHDSFYVWDWVTYEWDMTHSYECMYGTWLIHIRDMTHPWIRHDSCMNQTWDMTHPYMRHDSFIYDTWLILYIIHVRSVTWLPHVWHDSLMSEAWLSHEQCVVTSHVTHVTESCLIYEWVMSHIVHDSIYETELRINVSWRVMSHMWLSHVSYMNESCLIYEWVMSHICTRESWQFQEEWIVILSWGDACLIRDSLMVRDSFMRNVCLIRDALKLHDSVVTHSWEMRVNLLVYGCECTYVFRYHCDSFMRNARESSSSWFEESRTVCDSKSHDERVAKSHECVMTLSWTRSAGMRVWIYIHRYIGMRVYIYR